MKKLLLLSIISPILLFSQVQIGMDIDGETGLDFSGTSVSLSSDGSVVAIGARWNDGVNGFNSGHVRIYRNISNVWNQVGADIDGEAIGDASGESVSLSSDGSVVAIGAPHNDGNGNSSGHVRIYRNIGNVWTQIGLDIDGEVAEDESGSFVSLSSDGTVVAIGAPRNDGNGNSSGQVRIYRNISDVWTQIGGDIDGEAADDVSGDFPVSLSSDGSVVAIGAPRNDGNGNSSGHVRIYRNISDVWTQIGGDIDGEAADDVSGSSVSLSSDGNIVAIGALGNDDNGNNSGHVRIYRNISNIWTQVGADIDGKATGDWSGSFISLSSDGTVVAIGAPREKKPGSPPGYVSIYKNIGDIWTQVGLDIKEELVEDSPSLPVSISSDGSVVAIGASGKDDFLGHVRIFDLSSVLSSSDSILSQFVIYPNPSKEIVTIKLEQSIKLQNINIYNNLGQFISTSKNVKVDTSSLTKGVYFLEIETNNGKTTKKLIIE